MGFGHRRVWGIIPAAGRAKRMGGIMKELLPVPSGLWGSGEAEGEHVPVLAYSVRELLRAPVDVFCVVINSMKFGQIAPVVELYAQGRPVAYVAQEEPLGLGDAVARAARVLAEDDLGVMLMPDTVLTPPGVTEHLVRCLVEDQAQVGVVLHKVDNPHSFGVAVFGEDGAIQGFVDKPKDPPSSWVWTGVAFTRKFVSHIGRPVQGGEVQLTDALDRFVKSGSRITTVRATGRYIDVGTYDSYRAVLSAW